MSNILQIILMLASALLIIIADTIIKKESLAHGLVNSLSTPLMFVAYALYFIQIIIAIYIFKKGGELAIYTNLYIIFYSILGILTGIIVFSEHISLMQSIGIVFALIGAVLLNLK